MTKLSNAEISAVKTIMREAGWDVVLKLVGLKITELNDMAITGENEFQTLRELHKRDGKVEGIKEFFDVLERKAFE